MRKPKREVRARMQEHMACIMDDLGLDATKEPGLLETPRRFIDYLFEFTQPLNAEKILGDGFEVDSTGYHSMVVQTSIPFRMICEHHLLPAIGSAAVGYVPGPVVVGLSKLTRLVQAVGTERPNIQEAVCDRVADLLDKHLTPKGVIVVLRAEHTCMACRGVNSPGVLTTTSAVRGVFRDVPQARSEFFSLIRADER